ncbi:hypothetical protein JXA85_00070 [Candidatus Woesearchaeota archaeon]|nr:hypothetical protein [Candidatus Woesearchaeota archaeon]
MQIERQREVEIERWANFVRDSSYWKEQHTAFINAQFEKANNFNRRLLKTAGGKKKLKALINR